MIGRQILCAFSGRDDFEAASACPVHQFADQRRLVAIGEAVKATGRRRLPCQQGPGKRVRLDTGHDDVPAVGGGKLGMADRCLGISGGFHDDFNVSVGDQGFRILGQPNSLPRGSARRCRRILGANAQAGQAHAQAREIQIGDSDNAQARGAACLCQEHGTELSCPD